MRLITSEADLTVSSLRNPNYAGAVNYLRTIIENGKIIQELPEVPEERYDELLCAAMEQLKLYEQLITAGAAPSPRTASIWAPELASAPRVDRQWAYNGTTCARLGPGKISILFWLDNLLSALVGEYHITDGRQQGLLLRQLVEGPVLTQLTRKIAELPALRCAADRGEATFADYAAALIACADPDDALACHYAATHPKRHPGERLSAAVDRADLAFRAAAAHHCEPAAAGRFWAVYGLLTPSERSTYTGRPGVRAQLQRPLSESAEAAASRYQALFVDLLAWAKVQSTTADAAPPRLVATPAAGSEWRTVTPRRRRRAAAALEAAAPSRAAGSGTSAPNSSSDEEDAAAAPPAPGNW